MHDASSSEVAGLLEQAMLAARAGAAAQAVSLYERVLSLAHEHPAALNGLGNRALAAGDVQAARGYLQRAVRSDPQAAAIWLNLSAAERACGSSDGELRALDGALAADPYFVLALLHKAQWFERHKRDQDAVVAYRSLLQAAPALDTLPAPTKAALQHGKTLVDAADQKVENAIRAELGDRVRPSSRIDQALKILGGRQKIYLPKPLGLHFPFLPADQFFTRAHFAWFAELEAATDQIREELLALVRQRSGFGNPYVSIAPGTPQNQWATLNNSFDWSAIFLWNNGVPDEAVLARCPRTAAVLATLPMLDIPSHGPTAMFSTLRAHAHIPPHHGVTNIRSVVHLPLIVPPRCEFRVGSEVRAWEEGRAWAFDDTIEHEAWNHSDETRVILIVDAWNPYLTGEERDLLRSTNVIMQQTGRGHHSA